MAELPPYAYGGARALVTLHDRHLREFVEVWREFRASGAALPVAGDPDYASPQALLHHVLRAARGYMTWMCAQLGLLDPGIDPAPEPDRVEADADAFLEHVLERWRAPLAGVTEAEADGKAYVSRWGVPYTIDAMLEHAVMHPIRHSHQLRTLMAARPGR